MKYLKIIHGINKYIWFITILLYFTVYLGMLFQIVLGFVQVGCAIYLLFNFNKLDPFTQKRLKRYFSFVVLNFLAIFTLFLFQNDFYNFLFLFFFPVLIAFYFYFLTANFNNNSFLLAKWNNLLIINYEIDPNVLLKYVPKGTELDYFNDKCYVSLVGFMFKNVKLLGFKIPFHINFEEVNLRFYVKRFENNEWKRGVVFVKEIVPKPALAIVANTFYKEHYQTLPMKHSIIENKNSKDFVYQWKTKNKWNTILVETEKNPIDIEVNSEAEFITEHYFGYTKVNKEKTFEYEVKHPRWKQYNVTNHQIDVNFGEVYGNEFEFLNNQKPISVMLAIGSEISVENKKRIV